MACSTFQFSSDDANFWQLQRQGWPASYRSYWDSVERLASQMSDPDLVLPQAI